VLVEVLAEGVVGHHEVDERAVVRTRNVELAQGAWIAGSKRAFGVMTGLKPHTDIVRPLSFVCQRISSRC
jgi:hypothetical protein